MQTDHLVAAEAVVGLVALAIAGAAVADRLRTPAPSLLVVAGLGVGYLPGVGRLDIPPQAVTLGVLPPLLFAAAQQLSIRRLASLWRPVAALAIGLVALTAAAVAAVTRLADPAVPVAAAFTLGAVLASTDPVAVSALSRRLRLPPRIETLVQAESLFNDATSLVLFQVAAVAVTSGGLSVGDGAFRFVRLGGGGVVVGIVIGLVASPLLRRTVDPTVQAALALAVPYVAAVAAEAAEVSSVTGVIVAGLLVAARRAQGHRAGQVRTVHVYETVVFVLENVVFAVIGIALAGFVRDLPPGEGADAVVLAAVVTVTLLVVRAAVLGAAAALPARRRRYRSGDAAYTPWQAAAVVTWSGARGVVPLAAALSIPLTTDAGRVFPHRPLLLVVATAAVVVTLVVQGTTLGPLATRLGVVDASPPEER